MAPPSADPPAPVLRIEGLRLAYGSQVVLRDVDFAVHQGEVWFLLGPNGAGKSSLLRAILGGLRPAGGRIVRSPRTATPARTGFVPQRCALDPTLPTTVAEFVSLGLVGLPLQRRARAARVLTALDAAELASFGRRSFWSISEGERRRALLARALARHPRFLLLDEPTSSLDTRSSQAFWQLLARLRAETDLTVLCVSHDLEAAQGNATHVALFEDGTVHAGPVTDMIAGQRAAPAGGT